MRGLATLLLFAAVAWVRVPRVDNAKARRDGAKVVVTATATVTTAGWKNARLVQIDEKTFEFRAEPPEGMAAQVLSTLTATAEAETAARTVVVTGRDTAVEVKVIDP